MPMFKPRPLAKDIVTYQRGVMSKYGIASTNSHDGADRDLTDHALFRIADQAMVLLTQLTKLCEQNARKIEDLEARVGRRDPALAEEFSEGPSLYDQIHANGMVGDANSTRLERLSSRYDALAVELMSVGIQANKALDNTADLDGLPATLTRCAKEYADSMEGMLVPILDRLDSLTGDVKLAHERIGDMALSAARQHASPSPLADNSSEIIIEAINRIERKLTNFAKRGSKP